MNHIILIIIFLKFTSARLLQHYHGDFVTKIIKENGYKSEVHEIETSDGYFLKLHRLTSNDYTPINEKPAVFMLPGLFSSSGQFVQLGPRKSLGFYLADNGYDVWLGGMRGGRYGMKHRYLSSNSKKFWDFTLTEVALYDVAEQIDYILHKTASRKLFVTGVAVTTIPLTILMTEKPEYNNKIIQASFLSSVLWVGGNSENIVDTVIYATFYAVLKFIPFFQFETLEKLFVLFRENVCNKLPPTREFCYELYLLQSLMYGDTGMYYLFDSEYFRDFEKYSAPRLGSKFLRHVIQMKMSRRFARFENDSWKAIHNSMTSPTYDLSKITVPIRMQRGGRDRLMVYEDYKNFVSLAINSNVTIHTVENYAHGEPVYAKGVDFIIFPDVLDAMNYEKAKYLNSSSNLIY